MPTYTHSIGGKTYTFDSDVELTPKEQQEEATIFYMEDTQGERDHLRGVSSHSTQEERNLAAHPLSRRNPNTDDPDASIWKGIEEGAKDLVYGAANTVAHPVDTAKGLWDAQVHQGELATEERKKGNYLASAGRDLLAAVPVLGPFAADVGEDLTAGAVDNDPTRLGKGGFNSVLLGGQPAFKAVKAFGPGVTEAGMRLATSHPGIIPGLATAAEEYARTGRPMHSAAAGVAGGIGIPYSLKSLGRLVKDGMKDAKGEAGEAAEEAAPKAPKPKKPHKSTKGEMTPEQSAAMDEDIAAMDEKLGPDTPTPGNGGYKEPSKPRPFTPGSPNFLKQDVAGWKPGSKFNPADKSLSVPGRGTQSTKLLRGDESVMGLARELGLDVPDSGFESFPQPEGSSAAAQALRQRASISGQRNRTRPTKTAKKPLKGK